MAAVPDSPISLPSTPVQIGAFRLLAASHELCAPDGTMQRLPRRLVELLLCLAERPGVVLDRAWLLDRVWRRRTASDEALSRAIADLRIALADDARAPRYIETIPKTGYRLLAEVQVPVESVVPHFATVPDARPVPAQDSDPPDDPDPDTAKLRARSSRRSGPLWGGIGLSVAALATLWWFWLSAPGAELDLEDTLARVAAATPLSSDADWEFAPAVSADGQWLAYARAAPFAGHSVLVLRHLSGGEERVLPTEGLGSVDSPAFSPDGQALMFRSCESRACWWRVRSVQGDTQQVIGRADPDAPGADWSALGQLAVALDLDAPADAAPSLAWRAAEGESWRALLPVDASAGPVRLPRWIPGTRQVAYASGPDGLQSLNWVAVDPPHASGRYALPQSRIQDHRWWSAELAWVAADTAGFRALLTWQPDPAHWTLLGARGAQGLALQGAGGAVVQITQYDANLYALKLSDLTAAARRIEVSNRYEAHPALSADGRWLALVSLREGLDQVWLQDLDSGELRRISPLVPAQSEPAQAVRPSFAPDGRDLYFSMYSSAGIHAWRYTLEHQSLRRLDELGADVFAIQATDRPEEWIYATHQDAGVLKLWWRAPEFAAARPVPDAGAVVEFRVDGARLWWQNRGSTDLQGLDLRSGARQTLSAPQPELFPHAWTAAAGALYLIASDAQLYQYGPTAPSEPTSEWRRLGRFPASVSGPGIAVDPRHDRIVIARTDHVAADLYRIAPRTEAEPR